MRAYSTAAGSNHSPFPPRKAVFTAGKSAARERERAHYRLHESLFVLLRPFPCVLQHWLKEQVPKRAYTTRACVFLKMTFYLCVSGCGHYLAPRDGHERCIACLGLGSWGSVCGWVMYPLWDDDHLGVAIETPAPAKGWSPSGAASFQPLSEGCCERWHWSPVTPGPPEWTSHGPLPAP